MKFDDILPINNVLEFKQKLWFTEYAFRIRKWYKGEKLGPIRIDAEITRQCNLNCIFCVRRASKTNLNEESRRLEMPKERWVELARESGEMGVRNWSISGIGEPMTRPDILLPTMKMIKAYDMFGELTSNGTLFKDKYIKEIVEMGWDSVCISIDGPNAKIHDSLRRVKGTFEKATRTIKRFTYWRKKLKSDLPTLTINVVLNKMNYKKLPDMVKLAHKLGADALFVEPMILFSPMAKHLVLGNKEAKELPKYIELARELGEEYNILPTISLVGVDLEFDKKIAKKTNKARKILIGEAKKHKDPLTSIPCYAPWYYLMVRVDGSVLHCGEWGEPLDNIRNKSLREVWLGKKFEEVRKNMIKYKLPPSCDRCRPNIINDMRQIRRSIIKGSDVTYLQEEILKLIHENANLRRRLWAALHDKRMNINELIECKRELHKIKTSLTYQLMKKFGNSKIGMQIKKIFGRYA